MISPAKDIAQLISDAGYGTLGTDLFLNHEPNLPNDIVTVFDTGGSSPEPAIQLYKPTVMVRARGGPSDFDEAYAKLESIKLALHAEFDVTVNGSRYLQILAMGEIQQLGRDGNNRPQFTLNFRLMRTST